MAAPCLTGAASAAISSARAGDHPVIQSGIFVGEITSGQLPSISRKLHSGAASAIRPGKPRRPLILADSRRRGLDFSLFP